MHHKQAKLRANEQNIVKHDFYFPFLATAYSYPRFSVGKARKSYQFMLVINFLIWKSISTENFCWKRANVTKYFLLLGRMSSYADFNELRRGFHRIFPSSDFHIFISASHWHLHSSLRSLFFIGRWIKLNLFLFHFHSFSPVFFSCFYFFSHFKHFSRI